jgi:3-deoxy-manno-octulosonate cytidylyltransferase (CMP-KDO synthetase)
MVLRPMRNGTEIYVKVNVIIPARLGSFRFPRKSLTDILGIPMVIHVMKRAQLCDFIDNVYVATPDNEIAECVRKYGGEPIITVGECRRGSDRVYEAFKKIGGDIIVNLQGDEPLVTSAMLKLSIDTLAEDDSLSCVNLFRYISYEEAQDKNESKVVTDPNGIALYYSREPVPTTWLGGKKIKYKAEVAVMPFTADSITDFANLPMGELEDIESNDMLRFVEHGRKVKIVESPDIALSVDTPNDISRVEKLMQQDPLFYEYEDI